MGYCCGFSSEKYDEQPLPIRLESDFRDTMERIYLLRFILWKRNQHQSRRRFGNSLKNIKRRNDALAKMSNVVHYCKRKCRDIWGHTLMPRENEAFTDGDDDDTRPVHGGSVSCVCMCVRVCVQHARWMSSRSIDFPQYVLSAGQLIEFSTIAICIATVEDACDGRRRATRSHRADCRYSSRFEYNAHTRTHMHTHTCACTCPDRLDKSFEKHNDKRRRYMACTVSIAYSLIKFRVMPILS